MLGALIRASVKGRRCFCDEALCAFVTGPFMLLYKGF